MTGRGRKINCGRGRLLIPPRLRTPGCTTARRAKGSMRKIRFMPLSTNKMPSACGSAPPDKPVPAPRLTIGTPCWRQHFTTATTSASLFGNTTAGGRARNMVSPSVSKGAQSSACDNTRPAQVRNKSKKLCGKGICAIISPILPTTVLNGAVFYVMILFGSGGIKKKSHRRAVEWGKIILREVKSSFKVLRKGAS